MKSVTVALILFFVFGNIGFAESDHDHSGHSHRKEEPKKKGHDHPNEDEEEHDIGHEEDKHHDHKKEENHDEATHGEHDDHADSKFGEGKAITEVKGEGKRFKLADTAIKTLGLKSIKLEPWKNGVFEVPTSSVVDFQDEIGIFKRQGDWFELVEVSVVQRGKFGAKIKTNKLVAGDEIVNEGVALLRIAHLEASGQGGQGHVH